MTIAIQPARRNQPSITAPYLDDVVYNYPITLNPQRHSDMETQHDSFGKSVWVHA